MLRAWQLPPQPSSVVVAVPTFGMCVQVWPLETAFTSAHHCTTATQKAKLDTDGCGGYAVACLLDGSFAVGSYEAVFIFDKDGMGRMCTLTGNLFAHSRCPNASGNRTAKWDHPDFVRALAELPDGRLATGCDDGIVRIWTRAGV